MTILKKEGLFTQGFNFNGQIHVFCPSKKLEFDLWTSWIDERGRYHLIYTIDGSISGNCVLPFKTVEFYNHTINIPNTPETILDFLYHTWKVPIAEGFAKAKWIFPLG